jgi:hypothetical protein
MTMSVVVVVVVAVDYSPSRKATAVRQLRIDFPES